MAKYKLWTITDYIAGHKSQVLAVAELFKSSAEIENIELKYNKFSNLPNFLLGKSFITIDNKIDSSYPDIIISAGRRTVPIVRKIKKLHPNTKLIHILWPEVGIEEFDIILLPEHDLVDKKRINKNIITIEGSLSKVSPEFLNNIRDYWLDKFALYARPYISLIIGGDTKFGKFTTENAKKMLDSVLKISNLMGANLLVTTSRRTSMSVKNFIKQYLSSSDYFYDYDSQDENPYYGMMAVSEMIIVTADSISMCVDACSSGKKVGVWYDGMCLSKKHQIFLKKIFNDKYAFDISAKILDENFSVIDNKSKITKEIMMKILC